MIRLAVVGIAYGVQSMSDVNNPLKGFIDSNDPKVRLIRCSYCTVYERAEDILKISISKDWNAGRDLCVPCFIKVFDTILGKPYG